MEWQNIETAPKAGRIIWLGNSDNIRLGFWKSGKEYEHKGSVDGGWRDQAAAEAFGLCDLHFEPTHWQATPEPPKE